MSGIIRNIRFHQDHRRVGWFDIFPVGNVVDVNVVRIHKAGTITGWHRHQKQTDFWFVPHGLLQVGVFKEGEEVRWEFLSPEFGKVFEIEPNTWHGYRALKDDTFLIYGLTNKYDGSDEERLRIEDAGIEWVLPAK